MAAPSAVSVEAQSMSTTILRWTYAGTLNVSVWRSTDGVTYAEATTPTTRIAPGTTTYTDTGLVSGTKYYYKLSEDGTNFSSVVTVFTHFCADQNAGQAFQLPRFDDGQTDQSAKLNDMAERVERAIGDAVIAPSTCVICPSAGAVVIDCTDGCNSFVVIADQDINSFSINKCGDSEPVIDVYVPPSTTRQICGFPSGYGFDGNECNEGPISGGTNGRTLRFGTGGPAGGAGGGGGSTPGLPKTIGSGGGSGGGLGGTTCECVPGRNNQLTLKCCTASCSLSCASSTKELKIKVCGGVGPYTFTHTGSVAFKDGKGGTTASVVTKKGSSSPEVVVVPPTNAGTAVTGDAYWLVKRACLAATTGVVAVYKVYKCNDTLNGSCSSTSFPLNCPDGAHQLACTSTTKCVSNNASGGNCNCGDGNFQGETGKTGCDVCGSDVSGGSTCDVRTNTMITNGCAPCGVQAGAVITVTDSAGVSASITLRA